MRDMRRILLVGLVVVAGAALVFALLGTDVLFQTEPHERLPSGSARDFTDGNGIYYYNDGKYSMLYWKKKLFTPGQPPDEREMTEASQSATLVKKGVRFFSYGLELSYWPAVPPYMMAFCIIRDPQTIEGVYPLRIKLVERRVPIYELVPPQLFSTLTTANLFAINFQYSCAEGWVFRLQ
jgi:hypothetical protein